MTVFRLPDLGEGLTEAEIVAWHVGPGDHVVADQPLVSVETSKAVVELPSPQAGRIGRLCAAIHERVPVGAPLVEFEDAGTADPGAVVGALPAPPAGPTTRAVPAVRALAARLGVDLTTLTPTGPGGTIARADVERAAAPKRGDQLGEPLSGTRRAMAQQIALAAAVVAATVTAEADVSDWPSDEAVTVRLIRAVVAGCAAEPSLNAWYDPAAQTRQLHRQVDLGLAVDSPEGLFVPVLRDAGSNSLAALGQALSRVKAAVAGRSLAPAELRGQTITLSNFGTLGCGRFAALTVMPPQVAIIGAGRLAPRAAVKDGQIQVRTLLPLSLSFDHRVVSGGEAARFLAAIVRELERPNLSEEAEA